MNEVTAEYRVADLAPNVPLLVRPRVTVGAKTDLGRVRENNEDKHEFFLPEEEGRLATKGLVFVVCDGMGGHEAGQIASELATKTFLDVYLNLPSTDVELAVRTAVAAANRFVLDVARAVPSRRGMGTTLSALLLVQGQGYVAQVGDSRVYRLRAGTLERLTHDHTWCEEMVRLGALTREEAENHPKRHMLSRALGAEDSCDPDVFTFALEPGDTFLVCTDGVTNHVPDPQIRDCLAGSSPSEACWTLVGAALVGGGSDNATAVVVRIDGLDPVLPASE